MISMVWRRSVGTGPTLTCGRTECAGASGEADAMVGELPAGSGGDGWGPLLGVAQVAHRLGCSRAHVYRLINDGALRAVDIRRSTASGSKLRIPESDVIRFIDSRMSETP